jgi:hypothetical protein
MAQATYEKQSTKLVKVLVDGRFAGWIEQLSRRSSGLSSERYTYWQGRVDGSDVQATTLTGIKAKIAQH